MQRAGGAPAREQRTTAAAGRTGGDAMNVLDQLERSLSRAVDAGAARGLTPSATTSRRRRRLPRGLHLPLAVLAVGGLTTGALAATGNLPILKVGDRKSDPNYMQLRMPGFASTAKGPVRLLSLRARDPQGGPPWALRQFSIGRGQVCLQAGQLYRGRFGVVTQIVDRKPGETASGPAPARTVFQELARQRSPSTQAVAARACAARSSRVARAT